MLLEEACLNDLLNELDSSVNGHMFIDSCGNCDLYMFPISCDADLSQVNVLSEA